jgi:hypothetical protein
VAWIAPGGSTKASKSVDASHDSKRHQILSI